MDTNFNKQVVPDLLYKDEAYNLVGAAMEVRNKLGAGFLEPVYQEALSYELKLREIPFAEQVELPIFYKDSELSKRYIADMVAYDKIIIKLKALAELTSREEAQLINYLKASHMRLGLLINFGSPKILEWKRLAV
jgi:GxxExxY protein